MKKLFIIAAAIGLMYSCGGNTTKTTDATPSESTQMTDDHNAKTSLDYQGTYTGKLPTASGEGMIVTIELGENTFVKKVEYVGKKDITEEKGNYTWNSDGNTIVLEGVKDAPNKYFVGENTLTQLDMDGNKITGDTADLYILKK